MQAPGCIDCHCATRSSSTTIAKFALDVIKECGTCHADFPATYRDTFHGQVTTLGFARIATCASCHGAHEVLPASNPLSKVSAQNRLATCQQCHPGERQLRLVRSARQPARARNQLLFFTGKFMELLLLGVFSFFGIHTLLWFFRELAEVRRRRGRATRQRGETH